MMSKEQLQQQLREDIGSDEIPIVKSMDVSALSLQQLKELMLEHQLSLEGSRAEMENALIASLGCKQVDIVEMVTIDTLNVVQLEELLSGISRPPPSEENVMGNIEENIVEEPEIEIAAQEPPALNSRKKTIKEAQQELAHNCGFQDKIIWDLLGSNDANVMKEKIKQLIPDQEKGQKTIENLRNVIFENVWAQRKYTNRSSVSYIFYVMVTKDEDFNTAPESTEFSCHPVFRCKKCDNNSDSSKCCMIYVDETGRVYQNWKSFVNENVLPAGTMIAPRHGIYNFDKNNDVILDIYCTPSGTAGAKFMNAAQTGSAVAGIGAACVPLAALAMPIAAPVVAVAGLIGLGVGAFTSVTSALHLSDRAKHEQSISLKDSQARGSYLGMVGGAIGVAAAGATAAMTSMAAAGKATAGIEVFVNGINITSIVLSGSGVANGVLDLIFKYNDDEKISSLDVLQLSASLVLFTHSLYNFQLASQIANDARVKSIQTYRETLSNRQRKIFDKMSKETVRIRGNTQGKMDIIRGVNEIPDRQYLNDLFKINKQLNKKSIRPAFAESGKGVVLNNELPVETSVLRQSVQHQKGPNILEQVSQPIPSTHNSDTYTTQTPKMARLLYSTGNVEQNIDMNQDPLNPPKRSQNAIAILPNLAVGLPNGIVIMLELYGKMFLDNIADGYKFQDVILTMANHLQENVLRYLMELAKTFIENFLIEIERVLSLFIPTESVLYRILIHVTKNYSDLSYEYISKKGHEIIMSIKKFYLSLNPNNPHGLSKKCPVCQGMFYICQL
ncbi:uncharacterized protein LOC111681138 [Lucilia cuprina]|uniref:uncharacterized protein LOC111681138 n=1 Tax=Lucilia cuprina TaxID=7375 RepID=UPI001F05E94A|nr:uncharacterized protein LOC111681138 [Lucilia cuprina]